jgi:sarcosine oxidase subunit beta
MDTIIIGGGCMGASIAYHLAARGERSIALLERRGIGTGNTGKSGSIVRQHYSNPPTARMAQAALRVFQHWGEQIGGDCGFRQTGLLALAGQADAAALAESVEMQRGLGIDTTLLPPDDVPRLEPRVALHEVALACWEPEAGFADPIGTAAALAARARDLGVEVLTGTPVTRLVREDHRVVGVEARGGVLPAERVIVATNAWANELLAPIGAAVPIMPSRHAILALRRSPEFGPPHPILFDYEHRLYLRPDGDHFTLVGSSDPDDAQLPADPNNYHEGLLRDEIMRFSAGASSLMPSLHDGVVRGGWAGIYDVTPDWQPMIGADAHLEGLYLAIGFSGHGFKLSPIVGQWLADLLVTGDSSDLAPFRPDRFTNPAAQPIRTTYGVLG